MNDKLCVRCGQIKPISEFYRKYKNSEIFSSSCKLCSSIYNKEYRLNHPEDKERRKVISHNHYINHKEERKEYIKSWRLANPDEKLKRRKSSDLWMKAHPEKNAEYHKNRRARKKNSTGIVTADEWNTLLDFYGHRCLHCGRQDIKLTQYHIIPLKLGGKHVIDNLQPLCGSCNSKKHTKTIDYRVGWTQ